MLLKFSILYLTVATCTIACDAGTVRTVEYANGKAEIYLSGKPAKVFEDLIGHVAITPSEGLIIYGSDPNANLRCHEGQHQIDAAALADLLIAAGYLRDNRLDRFLAWIAIYTINHRVGYRNNLLERKARARVCTQENF